MRLTAGDVVRFKITIELETVEAICHADARAAAQAVGNAIEALRCERPGLEDLQLVEVRRVEIERVVEQGAGTF